MSTIYNECYVIYSDNFFSNSSRYSLFKSPEELINSKYLLRHNKKFQLKLLNYNEPQIIYKIINLLKDGKKILILFDEFPLNSLKKSEKHLVNYKIDNIVAAKIPISFFYILKKTNAQIVPIVNIRKGNIKNNLIIDDNISYDYTNKDFYLESERILKIIYDFYLKCIKQNPYKLSTYVWMRFYHYVKNNALLEKKIKDKKTAVYKEYTLNGNFLFYHNKKSKFYLIFRTNDLKCSRVDYLTVKILKELRLNNLLSQNLVKSHKKEDVENRISYLLQENFIV